MKGDFSKATFNAGKHFHDVLMQQGRVLLDQEWNEQAGINAYRTETGVKDMIGVSGTPLHDAAGFKIVQVPDNASPPAPGGNLLISKGRFYADGILCENETDRLFVNQPDFGATALPTQPGTYIFFLDVWLRHITALEDGAIREVALGGPDTTTRTKTVWQVKYISTAAGANCAAALPAQVTAASTGTLSARSEVSTGTDDPCGLITSGGYRRLENQLYRVEIHTTGSPSTRANTTFKWSRDNGSVMVKWTGQDTVDKNNLKVNSAGRDDLLGFSTGNWIEIIDDDTDLFETPGILVQLAKVNGNILTIDASTIKDPQHPGATSVTINTKNQRIRRWDTVSVNGTLAVNTSNNAWVALEDGVEVNFKEGSFKTGNYWLIPARTATADVEWPFTDPQPPKGIQHHYAKLAIAELTAVSGGTPHWTAVSDCRALFPQLTELTALYYIGGDGQEAMPGKALPVPLSVGVANGQWIVNGAKVKFEILAGGGSLTPATGIVSTGPNGIAQCGWTIGTNTAGLALQVRASLLDAGGVVLPDRLPVIFNAGFSIAGNVFYDGGDCQNWGAQKPATVADALTALCKRPAGGGKGCSVTVGKNGQFSTLQQALDNNKDAVDICICFVDPLDGAFHIISDTVLEGKRNVKFSGCGAWVSMAGKLLSVTAEKISLSGITVINQDGTGRIILKGTEVNIDDCVLARNNTTATPVPVPFVLITPATNDLALAKVTGSHFTASIALGLAQRVLGSIEGSRFDGDVILQYTDNPVALQWTGVNADQRKLTEAAIQQLLVVKHNNDLLRLSGNVFTRVLTNTEQDFKIPNPFLQGAQITITGYQSLIITENTFSNIFSSFFAEIIQVSNNQFLGSTRNTVIALALGQKGTVTGNIDTLFNGDDGAIIDTLFSRKITGPNLNLITVI